MFLMRNVFHSHNITELQDWQSQTNSDSETKSTTPYNPAALDTRVYVSELNKDYLKAEKTRVHLLH